ncbi:tricorn protease [Dysgonomonadaceae bacterium PH5-43]|nr:tricorn protease [Dysgonomonadaceae bacterium PH5-43]
MKRVLSLLICSTVFFLGSVAQNSEEARLLRFPTTNGSEIAFSYAGDLYKVSINGGQATRLTSHIGYEMFPKFSPDGKTIAFTGQYDGNTEVYTIPSNGGEPLRITYTPTNQRDDVSDRMGPNNIVMGWTPNGKSIIYRNKKGGGFIGQLYTVDKEGGLSEMIPLREGSFCSYSADGKQLAYNKVMREFRTWKYYKGGMADDIWIYNPDKQSVDNISNNNAQDIIPMWIGDNIFYISDRDRTMNMFVYNTKTKQTEKVTNFTEYDIKFPSANGNTIVFENGGYIYKLDATSRTPQKVKISLSSDNIYARSEIKNGVHHWTNINVSADGNRLVVTTRGEVFSVPVEKGVTKNITRTPGAHERNAQYSPDGRYISFISDITGETELYIQPSEGGDNIQLTKNNDTYIRSHKWSPDSKTIVYTDRENRINLLNVASKSVSVAAQEPAGEFYDVVFSPDSKWLAYSRIASNNYRIIHLYNIASKKEYAVTDRWYNSSSPIFSEDGKYLFFNSARDFNPTYGSLEWNHTYNNMNGMYMAILSKNTPSPFLEKDPVVAITHEEKKAEEKKDEKPKKEDKSKKEESKTNDKSLVNFDEEGISDRIIRIPIGTGNFNIAYANDNKVYYNTGNNSKFYDLTNKKVTDIADAQIAISSGDKKALFAKGNNIYVTNIPYGRANLDKPVDFSNMKITTDYPQEWAQIFDEAWRAFRDGFYVKNMHGVNWKAMKKKYEVLLPFVKNRIDLNYIIGEMIGELNCGHAYVSVGEANRASRINMGLLGAEISRDKSGFFRIEKIIPGASWSAKLRSPLTEAGIDANVGDFIVAIDGVATNSVKDMYSLLVGKANIPVELSLNSKASLNGARKVIISPISEEYSLYHYNWIQENIRKVDEASNGKIGYIYIPDMGVDGLNEFSRYFYPQLDKEGLIIDDRANGGGNVSPMILERLAREPYRLTMHRGSNQIGTIPDAVQVGPKVCLINKYSASDGDLFPWGFRALGIGKLIGTRTWGGIVGITSSLPFIDGTDIRVPFYTSYDPKTGEWIIENHGVDPDIEIDNNPILEFSGEDQQLNRAIEEVMKDLKNRKPLKPVPAPRVWNK